MTIHSHLSTQIKEAQLEALKLENVAGESLRGMEKNLEVKGGGVCISWTESGHRNMVVSET